MARRLEVKRLVIASHNPGKVGEIGALLAPFAIDTVSASYLGLDEPDETGTDFIANALIKSRAAADASGVPALADDSGLVVAALGGAPGLFSARWAGPDKDFAVAMARVERELDGAGGTPAHFTCALALSWPDGHDESFEGIVEGALTFPGRGTKGFGYDPIFIPRGHAITFGEMDPGQKDRISHRAKAFAHLVAACLGTPARG